MSGDGCDGSCRIEKIHSRGSKLARCFAQWSVANPTNYPGRDRRGELERKHECIDNDPLCDYDGGIKGSCTFHVRLCANYSEPAQQGSPQPCVSTPIDAWKIKRPSLTNAKKPLDARNRAAVLSAAAVLDSTQPDVCSDEVALEVPLRGRPGRWRHGRKIFEVHARSNDLLDKDRIMLSCLPDAGSTRKAPRFTDVWKNVLSKHCTFCHNPEEPCCDFLDFTTLEAARSTLRGVGREECVGYQRVVAGDPDLSLLYRKLVDTDVCGVRMPAQMTFPEAFHDCEGTDCLDAADVQLIRRWILKDGKLF